MTKFRKRDKAKNYLEEINYRDPKLIKSTLKKDIFKIVRRLCNSKTIKNSTNSYSFDSSSMPIHNLTKDRLEKAEEILKSISEVLKAVETRTSKGAKFDVESADIITELSNEFYELIPTTEYRTSAIPPIHSKYTVSKYLKMISDFLYTGVVVKLLCAAQFRIKEIHPVDYCFHALSFKMLKVPRVSEEFKLIRKYIKNGYQGSRKMNRFIANIFAIERQDERENISKWEKYGNKMMLWHGTKPENLIGILQTGFRIAPPDVSRTGSLFGEGKPIFRLKI